MDQPFSVYNVGGGGVNLVKDPLQLGDTEATQLQNAELVPDSAAGGQGALTKRGGLQALNASPLAGSVTGMLGLNLKTTYTRTLYVMRGSATSATFQTTTNGTAWSTTTSPIAPAADDKYTDANSPRDSRRMQSFRNWIVYPSGSYTKGTDNPPLALWDGTNALTAISIPIGPSATANTPAYAITDVLVANGKIWLAIHDPGGGAPSLAGRVLSFDLTTGELKQIAAPFGSSTGETSGGYPSCLAYYQGKIWAGLQGNTTTDAIGKVVCCYPDIDTTWTSDVANLSGFPSSMAVFNGALYVGTQTSVTSNAKVYVRSTTAGTYSASYTSAGGTGDTGYCGNLTVYNSNLYATDYYSGSTVLIKKFDGTSWTTDRDVRGTDGATTQMPGGMALLGSDLYASFRATSTTNLDGLVLRLTGGSWSKVVTDNIDGSMAVLVQRS